MGKVDGKIIMETLLEGVKEGNPSRKRRHLSLVLKDV